MGCVEDNDSANLGEFDCDELNRLAWKGGSAVDPAAGTGANLNELD